MVVASFICSNVNLMLEQLCLEGSRKQAKYAVSAIAAMTADSGLKALSVLYGVWRAFLTKHIGIIVVFFLLVLHYYKVELAESCDNELVS